LTKDHVKNLRQKLQGYADAYKEKNRDNDLTSLWIKETLKKQRYCCGHCYNRMTMDYSLGDPRQWSVDRRDNSQGHLQSNCWIVCLSCNHKLAPKSTPSKL
jgi:hypothetical protein